MSMVSTASWRIEGEPSSFLTRSEAEWKRRLSQGLAGFQVRPEEGLHVQFLVSSWRRGGNLFDLDNLAKPLFDVLGGPEVQYVDLKVSLGGPPGVFIEVGQNLPISVPTNCWMSRLIIGSVKHLHADPALRNVRPFPGDTPLRVQLAVHEPVSIADFGFTGFIKPTLDRLWPVVGGAPGRPHDHRIRHLIVRRSSDRPSGVSIGIAEALDLNLQDESENRRRGPWVQRPTA